MLDKAGYACDVAANGLEVLAALDKIRYAIILMDCQIRRVAATRRIRQS